MTEKKKYKSSRLEGIKGEWSDIDFLAFARHKVDWRTKNKEIVIESDHRFFSIINKIRDMTLDDFIAYDAERSRVEAELTEFLCSDASAREKLIAHERVRGGYDIHGNPFNIKLGKKRTPHPMLNRILDQINEE